MNGIKHENELDAAPASAASPADISLLVQALEAIYDPRSTNHTRQEATVYLERAKSQPHASRLGYDLAQDTSRSPVIRHYGLSMLEYNVRYRWHDLSSEEAYNIRGQVVELAMNVTDNEPIYLRNKIAQLWVEIAKRAWLVEWLNMDEMLCTMWEKSFAHREVVLHILETISEEVFIKEDTTAGLRGEDLGRACVDIFVSSEFLSERFSSMDSRLKVSYDDVGWIKRLAEMLQYGLENQDQQTEQMKLCLTKVLSTLRSVMPWIILKAVSRANLIHLLGRCITMDDRNIQMAAIGAMHALYHRPNFDDEDTLDLVCPFLKTNGVDLLRRAYDMSHVSHEDIEEPKYSSLKKLTEVLCAFGLSLERRSMLVYGNADVPQFLDLLADAIQNPSLVVSLPILYAWTKLLASPNVGTSDQVSPHVKTLLETCAQRLIRFESLPEETDDATLTFLNEDFDTVPEKHAFLGNYRRFCGSIIDRIVRMNPNDAIYHILGQAQDTISNLYAGQAAFDESQYKSNSMPFLRIDAHATVIAVAVKAYQKWLATSKQGVESRNEQSFPLRQHVEQWCRSLLQTDFQDPSIEKRVTRLLIEISTSLLPPKTSLPTEICWQVLSKPKKNVDGTSLYHEALKDLYASQPKDLQKLVRAFSDDFWAIHDRLDSLLDQVCTSESLEYKTKLDYRAMSYIVPLRTSTISDHERGQRIKAMIDTVPNAWQSPKLKDAVSQFRSFCELLGLQHTAQFFWESKAHLTEDWSSSQLTVEGLRMRDEVLNRYDVIPLQLTRSLLGLSANEEYESKTFVMMKDEWRAALPLMLPQLLQCLSHAHAFSNPAMWPDQPPELRSIIIRIFQDRVWQSGISAESRDDFFAKVRNSKSTLEGLASAIRGSIRSVREQSYWILHCMSRFGEDLYAHSDLPEPLAQALLADAHALSPHQFSILLKLSSTLADGCPEELRSQFLPPLLILLFKQLDRKITSEWESIERRKENNEAGSSLDQEMKDESVLRQLTHSAVLFVSHLLHNPWTTLGVGQRPDYSFRAVILDNHAILEPMILFCTHALRMRDSRSCSIITQVLRNLTPEFDQRRSTSSDDSYGEAGRAQVREFFSTEILKACITSIHEPYFSDLQKDLASLIAAILFTYAPISPEPREVLLSLPGMPETKVDDHLHRLVHLAGSHRQQRAIVLSMLEGIRGVSIHEQGKLQPHPGTNGTARPRKTAMQEQFSNADAVEMDEDVGIRRGGSPALEGVADLFG